MTGVEDAVSSSGGCVLTALTSAARAGLLVLALLALGGCDNRKINYRLTVSVETDEGVRTGSGVIGTVWHHQEFLSGLAGGISWHPEVHGQAIPIDLGQREALFVLLRGDPARNKYLDDEAPFLAGLVLHNQPRGMSPEDALTLIAHHEGTVDVPCGALPMMVRLTDITIPATVERVEPCDLTKSFGPGVRLARATIVVTNERPTANGIEAWLPWLTSLGGGYLTGGHVSGPGLAGSLHAGDFEM